MWTAVLFLAAIAAPGAEPFGCEAKEITGLPAEDAATAVAITCDELASVSGRSGAYRISLRSLGESVIMTVRHAGADDGRTLVLDGLKEVPTAAHRLAEALVLGKPIEETRLVDNLVQSEGRKLVTRPGSRKFELGALAVAGGQGTGTGGGFSIAFAYDSPTFAIPAEIRFAHSTSGDRDMSQFSIDTGARFYFSHHDVSPFVGGGLSYLYLSLSDLRDRDRYVYLDDSHWGPGLYVEGGLQIFRLHRGRLTAKVRADFPLYSLHAVGVDYQARRREVRIDDGKRYLVPITFGLAMSF
jgi:hypothetical protein